MSGIIVLDLCGVEFVDPIISSREECPKDTDQSQQEDYTRGDGN